MLSNKKMHSIRPVRAKRALGILIFPPLAGTTSPFGSQKDQMVFLGLT